MTEKGRALWILAILSPVVAELLSGSSPPLEFFSPISFAFLLGLYGGGVLIVRELSVIWGRGWMSVIVMGAAYGILEEGVAVKSFFDPNWMDLGGLGVYGRLLGTNWVWAVWLTIFHATISITLPILFITLLYPHLKGERILTRRRFEIVLVLLFFDVLGCTFILNPYVPLMPMYFLAVVAVFGLVFYAKEIPKDFMMPRNPLPTWSPRRFFILGFMMMFVSFVISGGFANSGVPFIVPIVLLLLIAAFVLFEIQRHMGCTNNRPQAAYLAAGFLGLWVPFGIVLEINGMPGMSVTALVTALFIVDFTRWSRGKRVFIFRVGRFLYPNRQV